MDYKCPLWQLLEVTGHLDRHSAVCSVTSQSLNSHQICCCSPSWRDVWEQRPPGKQPEGGAHPWPADMPRAFLRTACWQRLTTCCLTSRTLNCSHCAHWKRHCAFLWEKENKETCLFLLAPHPPATELFLWILATHEMVITRTIILRNLVISVPHLAFKPLQN